MMAKREVRIWLKKVEKDRRIHLKSADVFENAPLALEQMGMETTSDVLRRILGLPLCSHSPQTGRWQVTKKEGGLTKKAD